MPRRNRRPPDGPQRPEQPSRSLDAPIEYQLPGYEVRWNTSEREYRCPFCEQVVRVRTRHIVVVPQADVDARRHWHTGCWERELHRLRGRRR